MKILANGISGTGAFDNFTPERRAAVTQNALSFQALTLSSEPFPDMSKAEIRRLRIPTLILTGETTTKIHRLVTEELARLLPIAESAMIPKAGHSSNSDNPSAFNKVVSGFLKNQGH